ncbi:3-hydroxyacyl-ACP dehydratase FabZ family protein [Actinokineospora fastidiosa]|uniref:3-hydroxyacyl-[acyl-carrier-protein] dehydratase FabZ n=1 Tax=Actinokineospora fastidiosa TaxID=1816 RepID=A0A918LDX2_9PSEU|nr:3-hydroxyacyl-ACP dehydratase [Actinokineospora fastidiosa]GGS36179.1 3-hydroxyacyl-[acyl-carrier-protein] dehydratase FabZ [Actinokineospora fastidiosa]
MIADIRRVLPHRYPMLLVDAVTELVPGERLTARKAVTANEPWYADLPDDLRAEQLAYPQVLLVESWCQAAGVLATWESPNPDVLTGTVMLFGGISGIEFHRPVMPGDVVEHHVEVFRALTDTVMFTGRSTVDGEAALTVSRIVMAFRPASVLLPDSLGRK